MIVTGVAHFPVRHQPICLSNRDRTERQHPRPATASDSGEVRMGSIWYGDLRVDLVDGVGGRVERQPLSAEAPGSLARYPQQRHEPPPPGRQRQIDDAIQAMLVEERFGRSGKKIVVEERLEGPELSFLAVTDGTDVVPLAPARDYKRAQEGDEGANTGGMGAITDASVLDNETLDRIVREVVEPTLEGAAQELPVASLFLGSILRVHERVDQRVRQLGLAPSHGLAQLVLDRDPTPLRPHQGQAGARGWQAGFGICRRGGPPA